MKKTFLAALMTAAVSVTAANAADLGKMVTKAPPPPPPSAWDVAFGAVIMSDYNFRGVSQSNRSGSVGAYFEPQLTTSLGVFYVGLAGYSIDWRASYGFTDPAAEIDLYGGWRKTWGQFSVDLGGIYYYYPKETWNGWTSNSDFWEVYAKLSYAITPDLTVGANVFYSPDVLNYSKSFSTLGAGADAEAVYASLTGKWVTPWKSGDWGLFLSGEIGHWWIDDAGFTNPVNVAAGALYGLDPSYTYWNAGLGITYKAFTLDLRYHGTDMSENECSSFLLLSQPGNAARRWCGDTFIASLKFDTALSALK